MKSINKRLSAKEAVSLIKDGSKVMVGGFGLRGYPEELVEALAGSNIKNLTIISNDLGSPGIGLGKLLNNGQIKKLIGTHYGNNPDVVDFFNKGIIEIELMPQGNFAEAIRAAGVGIPAFYTPIGYGTDLSIGKEIRTFNGINTLLITSLEADVALIKAYKADHLGNLVYYKTARNFNPIMAMAGKLVIAQVDEIVPTGTLDPEMIITPHVFVDILVERSKGDVN
ncbi:MAG: CoA transferase subunit A [bacterium]